MRFMHYITKDPDGNVYEHALAMDEVKHIIHFFDSDGVEKVMAALKSYHILTSGDSDSISYMGESASSFWQNYKQWQHLNDPPMQ